MPERPSPGLLSGIRNALDDAEIANQHGCIVTVLCVSPSRAARLKAILDQLQKDGPDL
jgi:hypothetical protein